MDHTPGTPNEPLWTVPVLRFWTWRMGLCVTVREQQQPDASGPGEGLCHCNIVDKQVFVAISDAKSFTVDECPVWNYCIPKNKDESE
ncbi:hypothetical protein F5X96DRAFT_669170 [Biscogniauxia mediterranea]|nr:hypothetical protein F5X96DRAFT_669170 [Biscogniauxia mediterranea]